MKIQRFFSLSVLSVLMLALSYAPSIHAMEALEDVAAADITRVGDDFITKDGDVLTGLTKDEADAFEEAIAGGDKAAIKDAIKGFGKDAKALSKAESEAFLKTDSDAIAALRKLNPDSSMLKGLDVEASALGKTAEDLARARQKGLMDSLSGSARVVDRLSSSIETVSSKVESNLQELATALKEAKGDITSVSTEYTHKLEGLGDDVFNLGEKDPNTGELKYSRSKLKQMLKGSPADRKLACLKIAELDSIKGLVEEQAGIVRNGGTKTSELTDALNSEIKVVRDKFSTFEKDSTLLDSLTDEVDTADKDVATGAAIKTTKLKIFMKDFGTSMEEVQGKLDTISNDINIKREKLGDKLGIGSQTISKVKAFFSDGAIGDSVKSMKRSLKSVTREDVVDGLAGGAKAVGRGIKSIGAKVLQGAEMVLAGVMFMIPNIFQSSLLAQKQRQAELQTLATPIKIGDWVLQIPNSCIDIANPESSFPLYVRIPVANIGDTLSQTYTNAKGDVVTVLSGPNTDNVISRSIHTAGALILTGGSDLSAKPNRYKIHDSYFADNPSMVLAYFAPGSYATWGSVPLTSSQWTSGQVIDISNGMVIDGDSNIISTMGIAGLEPYPLITPADWHAPQPPQPLPSPTSIKDFLPTMLSKLSSSGNKTSFIQYGAGITSGPTASTAIASLFENKDFDNATKRSSTDKLSTPCVITAAYDAYANGLSFTAATATSAATTTVVQTTLGKTLTSPATSSPATSNLSKILGRLSTTASPATSSPATTSSNPVLLKSVLPVYGWGDQTYASVMTGIPTASLLSPSNLAKAFGGITAVSGKGASQVESPKFAADVNYAAQACWVYVSADTPFAQSVQTIVNANQTSWLATGPVVDYIMFLDSSSNPAPLLKPIQTVDSKGITTISMGLNPDIAYWTSLIAHNLAEFQDGDGNPIMYDLTGNALSDPGLGGKKGIIENFINEFATSFGGAAGTKANANLFGQFVVHKETLLGIYNNGPFKYGNDYLTMSNTYNLTVPGSSGGAAQAEINFYTGTNCFGTSGSVSDLLVAMDGTWTPGAVVNGVMQPGTLANQTSTALPDPNATMFYSLITDIGYLVQTDGSLLATDFSQAPCTQDATGLYSMPSSIVNPTKLNPAPAFNVLSNMLESGLEANYALPSGTTSYISKDLMNYVTAQRKAWAQQFDGTAQGGAQKQGITLGALTCKMPSALKATAAITSKCYVYEIIPSPSAALCDHDLFVITNSQTPSLDSLKIQDASNANASTATVVSLITGFLFDTQGNQIMHKDGVTPRRLTISAADLNLASTGIQNTVPCAASAIFNFMTTKYPWSTIVHKADASTFVPNWSNWVSAYETQMNRLSGPYSFGGKSLFIRSGDLAIGNAVYVTGTQPHSPDFTPQDVYVTYSENSQSTGGLINSSTNHILSLISGQLYDAKGSTGIRLPSAIVQQTTQTLQASGLWGTWLTDVVSTLQEAMNKRLAEQEKQQQDIDDLEENIATAVKIADDFATPQVIKAIIKRLQPGGTKGLPVPYSQLQYDPVKQIYVHLSAASTTDKTDMLYLFFNIGTDSSSGTPEPVGGVYDNKGVMHRAVRGVELQAMCDQFGVVIHKDGTQTLGIPMTQPSLYMTSDDQAVISKPGADSADFDLISSTSPNFPGGSITMKLGYNLYFSKTMNSYYVYDTKNSQWVSIAGGHLYTDNGAPFAVSHKVAMRQKSSSKKAATVSTIDVADDMILLYENQKGNLQGYMSDGQDYVNISQVNQSKGAMSWETLSENGNQLSVTQSGSKTKTYAVSFTDATTKKTINNTYVVDASYEWHDLVNTPIDSKGNLLTTLPASSYKSAQIVMKGAVPSHVIFNQVMYKNSSSTSGDDVKYTMVPVDSAVGSNKNSITLTVDEDLHTKAPQVTIVDGTTTYRYCYVFDKLDDVQLDKLRTSVIRGSIAPSTIAIPVGPFTKVPSGQKDKAGNPINVMKPASTTRVIFAQDIPGKSSSLALSKITIKDVKNAPQLPASGNPLFVSASQSLASLEANIGLVVKSTDGRFFAQIDPSNSTNPNALTFSYVTNGAYVDLQTGVLFDLKTGICLEYCLNLDDWISVLNTAQVSVVFETDNKTGAMTTLSLVYRNPQAMKIQLAQLESDVHKLPATGLPATGSPATGSPVTSSPATA